MKLRKILPLLFFYHHFVKYFTLHANGNTFINREISNDGSSPVVAYLVSFTNVPHQSKASSAFIDAAAVLKRSIELNSLPLNTNSRYRADYFALFSADLMPAAASFVEKLLNIGYTVKILPPPVDPNDIEGAKDSFFKREIQRNGCCGHKELMKLYSLTFTNHTVAVHLDLDTLLLQPLDELFDVIQYSPFHPKGIAAREQIAASVAPTHSSSIPVINTTVSAFFTKDYNMVPRGKESRVGVQGGFLVFRPNMTTFYELSSIVKEGNFSPGFDVVNSGWRSSGYGSHIWGAATIQGLLAYYYDIIAYTSSVELNRCQYNQIGDNPRRSSFDPRGKYPRGTYWNTSVYQDTDCRDGREKCDDVQCQTWPINQTKVVHFTYCKTPWKCPDLTWNETKNTEACRAMHKEWFRVRMEMQDQKKNANGTFQPDYHFGFCDSIGINGYIPLGV